MTKFLPKILSVGCWNIEGMYETVNGTKLSKLDDDTFLDTLKKFDIFCLQETHTAQNDVPKFEKYVAIPHCRNISANNRYFGGMLLFIRRTLRKGVKINRDIKGQNIIGTKSFLVWINMYVSFLLMLALSHHHI